MQYRIAKQSKCGYSLGAQDGPLRIIAGGWLSYT